MSTDKHTPFLMDHPCLQSCVSPTSLKSIFLGNSLLLNQLKALRKMSDVFNVDPRPHIGPGRSHMACFPFGLPHWLSLSSSHALPRTPPATCPPLLRASAWIPTSSFHQRFLLCSWQPFLTLPMWLRCASVLPWQLSFWSAVGGTVNLHHHHWHRLVVAAWTLQQDLQLPTATQNQDEIFQQFFAVSRGHVFKLWPRRQKHNCPGAVLGSSPKRKHEWTHCPFHFLCLLLLRAAWEMAPHSKPRIHWVGRSLWLVKPALDLPHFHPPQPFMGDRNFTPVLRSHSWSHYFLRSSSPTQHTWPWRKLQYQ